MRSKPATPFKTAITAALSAVGIKESEINISANRLEIPTVGIVVTPALVQGKRVWKAERRYSVMRLEDAFETQVVSQLFTVALEDDLLLVRKLALQAAEIKVDAAIDAVVTEDPGSLQR